MEDEYSIPFKKKESNVENEYSIPFKRKESNTSFDEEGVPLLEWIREHSSEEELQSIFLNIDRALKYIHDHGYCIEVFYPTEIYILNNEDDYIQFKSLMKLPNDISLQKEYIKEDIFNSVFLQVAIYSKSLKYLKPEFLREHFEEFSQFLPSSEIPYYRGVIERGASVYLCEYSLERRNRELAELEKELGESSTEDQKTFQKNNVNITNDKINDIIYRNINGLRDAAFVHTLIIPTVILATLLLAGMIVWFFSFFM